MSNVNTFAVFSTKKAKPVPPPKTKNSFEEEHAKCTRKYPYQQWCKMCRDIEEGLYNWQMAVWEEMCKPEHEQNEDVFRGHYKVVKH